MKSDLIAGDTALCILCEPYDWYCTAREIYNEPYNHWVYVSLVGLISGVSGVILERWTGKIDEAADLARGVAPASGSLADRLAAQRFRSVSGVEKYDRLAAHSPEELQQFLRDVEANGWIVKATTKLPDDHIAWFLPRKGRFYYDPERMTILDCYTSKSIWICSLSEGTGSSEKKVHWCFKTRSLPTPMNRNSFAKQAERTRITSSTWSDRSNTTEVC